MADVSEAELDAGAWSTFRSEPMAAIRICLPTDDTVSCHRPALQGLTRDYWLSPHDSLSRASTAREAYLISVGRLASALIRTRLSKSTFKADPHGPRRR